MYLAPLTSASDRNFGYDGAGGREVTAYVYDGPDILMDFDGAGGFLARYAHG